MRGYRFRVSVKGSKVKISEIAAVWAEDFKVLGYDVTLLTLHLSCPHILTQGYVHTHTHIRSIQTRTITLRCSMWSQELFLSVFLCSNLSSPPITFILSSLPPFSLAGLLSLLFKQSTLVRCVTSTCLLHHFLAASSLPLLSSRPPPSSLCLWNNWQM